LIANADDVNFDELPSYDVIIVGAGAVGIVAAVDLARRGLRVLLLEAGPQWIDKSSQDFFTAAESVARKHHGLHNGRFRALGGTTNFWGGQLARLDYSAFQKRPWLKDYDGWPIAREAIEPYYAQCEELLEIPKGLRDDKSVFQHAGIPDQSDAEELEYFLTRWLTEKNFGVRFRKELNSKNGVFVITEAPVVSLRASHDGQTVDGVQIRTKDNKVSDLNARYVILANGTIEIARLLMHPLAGGQKSVWADNRWLGRGFMEHLEGTIGIVKPRDLKRFNRMFDNLFIQGIKFQPRLRLRERIQIEQQALSFALHLRFEASNLDHLENAKIFFNGLLKGRFKGSPRVILSHLWSAARIGFPMCYYYIANQRILSPKNGRILLRVMLEQVQLAESKITLSNRTDKLGMRVPELSWVVSGDEEVKTIQIAAKYAKKYFEENGLADFVASDNIANVNHELLDGFQDTYHHMGGARMASSADLGVVDVNARVFGTRNLFVAGAAILPSVGFANPTFTAMALTLKLAEHIDGECSKA
jgi:GMC oxidoreductase/FAD dependent oxidoreductase